MEYYIDGVEPRKSSEEALRRWRQLCLVVKNPKRKFRQTANLQIRSDVDPHPTRSEAEAMEKSFQKKLRAAVSKAFSMASNGVIDARKEVEESGHGIDASEKSLKRRQNGVKLFVYMTLIILAVCAFAFLAVRISAKRWPKGAYFSNIGLEKSVKELEKNSKEVITRIDDILHVIQDLDASRKDHQRDIESLQVHLDASKKDLQRNIASLKEQLDASRKDLQRDIAILKEQSDASGKDLQHDIASLREHLQELSSRIDNSQPTSYPSQEIVENIRLIEDLLYQIIQECRQSSVSEWNPSSALEKISEGAINFVIGAYHEIIGTRIEGEFMIAHGAYEWVSSYWNSGKKVEKEEQKCLIHLQQLEKILDLVKKPLHLGDGTRDQN